MRVSNNDPGTLIDIGDAYIGVDQLGSIISNLETNINPDALAINQAINTISKNQGLTENVYKSTDSKGNQVDLSDLIVFKTSILPSNLVSCGYNNNSQLGVGDTNSRSSPVQVGSYYQWRQVWSGKDNVIATGIDGNLYRWGNNSNGQLGLGNTSNATSPAAYSPTAFASSPSWVYVPSSGYGIVSSAAIKSDGTLWTWGQNSSGQLGLGDNIPRSSPVQVGSPTNWKSVSVGGSHMLGIASDSTLWAWGDNSSGQLGLGNSSNFPSNVGSDTWLNVSTTYQSTAAVKSDGSLWACGYNGNGNLGLGDTVNRSSPVQVGSYYGWNSVVMGRYNMFVIGNDNSLWVCGDNSSGQLGLGNTTYRSSPVQVGSLTNWQSISCFDKSVVAVKTDGSMWVWGDNAKGQLALKNTTSISSPVQISTLNWKNVSLGASTLYALNYGMY